jgi:FMN phosphatase YigB (HAD superfamily)
VVDAVGEATLVAAHAWDAVGAVRAGLQAVWVNGDERVWPFPDELFDRDRLREVPRLVDVQAA